MTYYEKYYIFYISLAGAWRKRNRAAALPGMRRANDKEGD